MVRLFFEVKKIKIRFQSYLSAEITMKSDIGEFLSYQIAIFLELYICYNEPAMKYLILMEYSTDPS